MYKLDKILHVFRREFVTDGVFHQLKQNENCVQTRRRFPDLLSQKTIFGTPDSGADIFELVFSCFFPASYSLGLQLQRGCSLCLKDPVDKDSILSNAAHEEFSTVMIDFQMHS